MTTQHLQVYGFLIVLLVGIVFAVVMWWPYATLLFVAATLAILFTPTYRWFLARLKRPTAAALLTVVLVLLIVVVPLIFLGQVLVSELVDAFGALKSSSVSVSSGELLARLPEPLKGPAANFLGDLNQRLAGLAGDVFATFSSIVSNVASFFLYFFLLFFSLYYLLKDGDRIVAFISDVLPLSERHENIIFQKLTLAVTGVVKGSFLVALAQGVLATAGFLVFRMPEPLLWGVFATVASLVPNIGTGLAFIPAVGYLLLTGHVPQAVGLMVWGALLVGNIDNVLRPQLVGSRTHLHPLLVLFGVLGGVHLFGFIGIFLGPVVAALLVTLLNIYRTDLKPYLSQR